MGGTVPIPSVPDLGPVHVRHHEDAGLVINVAGVIDLARTGGTPKARKVYREFLKAFEELRDAPLSDGKRQFEALRIALATIGVNIGVPHTPGK